MATAQLKLITHNNLANVNATKTLGRAKVVATIDETAASQIDTAARAVVNLTGDNYVDSQYVATTSIVEILTGGE